MYIKPLILVALLLSSSCKDPQPQWPTGEGCVAAEENLKILSCDDPKRSGKKMHDPNKKGEGWAAICARAEKEGKVSMRTDCVSRANSCEEVLECTN